MGSKLWGSKDRCCRVHLRRIAKKTSEKHKSKYLQYANKRRRKPRRESYHSSHTASTPTCYTSRLILSWWGFEGSTRPRSSRWTFCCSCRCRRQCTKEGWWSLRRVWRALIWIVVLRRGARSKGSDQCTAVWKSLRGLSGGKVLLGQQWSECSRFLRSTRSSWRSGSRYSRRLSKRIYCKRAERKSRST